MLIFPDDFLIGKYNGSPIPTWQDIILSSNTALTLVNSKANGLNYLKLFGKCEQKSVLPDEFQRVEYLETDGNQYIDTGILLNNTDGFEITFQSSKDALTTPVMGAISGGTAYTSTNNISVTYNVGSNVNAYSIYNNSGAGNPNYAWNGGDYTDKLKHTIKYTGLNTVPTIDGEAMTQITSHTISVSDASVTTWLFGRSNTGTGTKAQDGIRIYDANFYSKGHFIPCRRKSDSILGMYDTVTGTFLTNAGTGEFTAGANVTIPTPDNIMPIWCNNGEIKYGFGQNLIDNTIDGQGTYATQSASTANRIFKAFGNISTGKYKVTISDGYEFMVQYRNSGGGLGNIGTWNTSGEYDLDNSDYSYGIAIRYPDNSAITPEDFNGTLSLQIQGIYTDGTIETVTDSLNNAATAEMLLSVGDYKDEQSVLDGVVTRNIGIKVFDGTENWTWRSKVGGSYCFVDVDNININTETEILCSHYGISERNTPTFNKACVRLARNGFVICDEHTATSATEFQSYLADQYAQGTPVIVVYPLETPATETVEAQSLTIQAGTNIITAEGSIDNLELEISYKGKAG